MAADSYKQLQNREKKKKNRRYFQLKVINILAYSNDNYIFTMLVTHQCVIPRWKEWVPLATHQLRLRNLIQVLAFSIKKDKERINKNESYYYTLHSTTMSAPFYTSEKLETDSPKWKEVDITSWTGDVCRSANGKNS